MNIDILKGKIPDNVFNELPKVQSLFGIDTALRLSHFLGQCSHESGKFKITRENLNYSADRLVVVFKKYFPDVTIANAYAKKPEKIANIVYASRMGNGDKSTGDGWKYRGRGYIQLTFKQNYSEFDAFVEDDIVNNPDLVATKYPLLSAGWFFYKNNLNSISDEGSTDAVVKKLTKRINGGYTGLDDRIISFNYFYKLLQ